MRVVTLPHGRQVSLGSYVAGIKLAMANPDEEFKGFNYESTKGSEVARRFREGVQDRINSGIPRGEEWKRSHEEREDRKGVITRVNKRMRKGLIVRSCKWCGSEFKPKSYNDRFCEESCQRSYYN
jgi:hypothetical protein